MTKLGAHSVAELVRSVDYVLAIDTPQSIVTADHRVLHRPRVLDIMAAALRDAETPGATLTTHSESTRAHPRESFGSVDHPPAM
jgi:hypothetical protein